MISSDFAWGNIMIDDISVISEGGKSEKGRNDYATFLTFFLF